MFENVFQKYVSAKNIIFFIIAILFIVFLTKIKDIAVLFFASYVIACSLNPLVDKLSKNLAISTKPNPYAFDLITAIKVLELT